MGSHNNHPFELEPELRPLLTCTCSPQRLIRAFGRCAGKGWLLERGGQQQLEQRFGAMRSFGRLRVEGVSSSRSRGDEPGARCCDAAVCTALESCGGLQPNLKRIACGLYAWDVHAWKLSRCLLRALGTDQSGTRDGIAIR